MTHFDKIREFAQEEEGVGSVFMLFMFMVVAVIVGITVDGTNAWRNSTMLASAADIGSHAGAVALANGKTEAQAIAATRDQVRANLPESVFGNTVGKVDDVTLLSYDIDTRQLSYSGPKNAIGVTTNQLSDRGNSVGTFLLSFAGVNSFDVNAVSVAVFDYSAECNGTDGIYSEARVRASSQNYFGAGYCVHSNDHVWLPQQNTFEAGSMVTMPDLVDCKNKCDPSANPGIVAAEVNMVFPDFGEFIDDTFTAFLEPGLSNDLKAEFFALKPVGDTQPLIDAGVLKPNESVLPGEVISLTKSELESIETLPAGLVYSITCSGGGNGKKTRLELSGTGGKMENAALLTNCSLDFKAGSDIKGSLVITTREISSATVTADSNVTIGDSTPGQCIDASRTTIMSKSKMSVPAKFAASSVSLIVDDTVDIASSSSSGDTSYGLSIYATDEIDIASQHTFLSCGEMDEIFVPRGKVIRHVAAN